MLRKLNMVLRLVCIAAGLCMIDPGAFTDLIGAAVLIVLIIYQMMLNRKEKAQLPDLRLFSDRTGASPAPLKGGAGFF